jgi:hypothetical protein
VLRLRPSREPEPDHDPAFAAEPDHDPAFAALMLLAMTADEAQLETCEEALIWLSEHRSDGFSDALDELRLAVRLGRTDQAAVLLPDLTYRRRRRGEGQRARPSPEA